MQEFPIRLFEILGLVTASSCGKVLKLECLFSLIECTDSQEYSHMSDIERVTFAMYENQFIA